MKPKKVSRGEIIDPDTDTDPDPDLDETMKPKKRSNSASALTGWPPSSRVRERVPLRCERARISGATRNL